MFKKINSILKNPISPLILIAVFIIISILFFTQSKFYKKQNETEIDNHQCETIGLTTRIKSTGKSGPNLHYYFYHNNERVLGKIDGRYLDSSVLAKFYTVKFDENDPAENEMILENEFKSDSVILLKLGFKHIKYYTHNISTNTYEENWKWE
jgi:hypothetical protein